MTARSRRLLAVLFAMLLLVAACGGGDDTGGDDNDTNTTQADDGGGDEGTDGGGDEGTDGGGDEGTDGGGDDGGSDGGGADDGDGIGIGGINETCLEAAQAMAAAVSQYSTGVAGVFGGTLDDDDLAEAAEQLQAMADAAPEEIQDDLAVIAGGLEDFYTALAESGYVAGQVPSAEQIEELSALAEVLDQEAFQEASGNINAWFEANCD